ncbi:F-box domain [Teratosphaeria destructans]|uniref:F-box domain n=1 Tax=Teratosphaeria destructans TaxID=418781 RepID=A0A9W7W125_9PEZI|nr:F-box domain [Teratosphaeria destructans]
MVKRSRESPPTEAPTAKRIRPVSVDRLSRLSDELILRIFSFLSTAQLVVCQRLSRKYQVLGGDGQLWKAIYYDRFVRPRASRLPGQKDGEGQGNGSKASRWLDDQHLTARDAETNWKKQYKLRHNWTRGSCAINEIEVAEQAAIPPVLVQMHDSVIYMANMKDGLRAWSAKGERKMLAHTMLDDASSPPTSLSVDTRAAKEGGAKLLVGFEDGGYGIYSLDEQEQRFTHHYTHQPSSNGVISASAVSWPFVATMTATQLLSLYRFNDGARALDAPLLLHSLKSHTVWPPLSVSLRTSATSVVISIAYAIPTYLSGWTVGLQEVSVSPKGDLLHSRLASAIEQHYRPLAFAAPPVMHHLVATATGTLATSTTLEFRHIHSKPISLSYTHPYLLVSHPDNTLTLYLVTSSAEELSISPGSRLWGHTSSVSGAHVGGRGKAVSVSKRGDELRVWELEGGFTSSTARKRLASGDLSVKIRSESHSTLGPRAEADLVRRAIAARGPGACSQYAGEDLTLTRGWIGFDDENVVVLKEQSQGRQALVVYDFT